MDIALHFPQNPLTSNDMSVGNYGAVSMLKIEAEDIIGKMKSRLSTQFVAKALTGDDKLPESIDIVCASELWVLIEVCEAILTGGLFKEDIVKEAYDKVLKANKEACELLDKMNGLGDKKNAGGDTFCCTFEKSGVNSEALEKLLNDMLGDL